MISFKYFVKYCKFDKNQEFLNNLISASNFQKFQRYLEYLKKNPNIINYGSKQQ